MPKTLSPELTGTFWQITAEKDVHEKQAWHIKETTMVFIFTLERFNGIVSSSSESVDSESSTDSSPDFVVCKQYHYTIRILCSWILLHCFTDALGHIEQ